MTYAPPDTQPLKATAFMLTGMAIIGVIDNLLPLVNDTHSVWMFHILRTGMALPLMALGALWGLGRLRVTRLAPVLGRSVFMASALTIYFASLAFLPIGIVVAGLFTAPIFVLVISVLFRGVKIGFWRLLAVATGFAGVVLVVWPSGDTALGLASVMPVLAGLFYAIASVATRSWCEGEDALAMSFIYFALMGVMGLVGVAVLAGFGMSAPAGSDGWVLRGWVMPDVTMLWVCFAQALGSAIAVVCLTRGYQLGEASFVAVNEYALLIFASFFAWLIWDEVLGITAMIGMALIVGSGALIALRSK